jgi:hypothetical protein
MNKSRHSSGRIPALGFPELSGIWFEFADDGDLTDIKALSWDDGTYTDSAEFDGAGLLALSHEAQEYGKRSDYFYPPVNGKR